VLIEHFAGALPDVAAPVQVVVATITSDANAYAEDVVKTLRAAGLRVELDIRNEKVGYKIREHSLQKTPAIAVVGKKEAEERSVAIRRFGSQDQHVMSLSEAVEALAVKCGGYVRANLDRTRERFLYELNFSRFHRAKMAGFGWFRCETCSRAAPLRYAV
jgi:threonyl-tRNA synthetase